MLFITAFNLFQAFEKLTGITSAVATNITEPTKPRWPRCVTRFNVIVEKKMNDFRCGTMRTRFVRAFCN